MEKSYLKIQPRSTMAMILLIIVISLMCFQTAGKRLIIPSRVGRVGACYGNLGDNLAQPNEVVSLCIEYKVFRIRLYNPVPSVLEALRGHKYISVMLGVVNNDIISIAQDATIAKSWVQDNVVRYNDVYIQYITVGNEILPLGDMSTIAASIPQAMRNIYDALSAFGLADQVHVSTVFSMEVMGQSYPPSAGAFKPEFTESFIIPIVKFLVQTNSRFLINVYPYFTYISDPDNIGLDYALFKSPSPVITDGPYEYWSLFDAMLDSVHASLEKVGGASLQVVVAETGWPTDGGTATSVENAGTYNNNLVQSAINGTPRRPEHPIETYIFDLIDENQKNPELEKHWGVFSADLKPKYPFSFL